MMTVRITKASTRAIAVERERSGHIGELKMWVGKTDLESS